MKLANASTTGPTDETTVPARLPLGLRDFCDDVEGAPPAEGCAIGRGAALARHCTRPRLDNLEWASDCAKHIGLVHVHSQKRRRVPKASARFYAEVIATHGANL